MTRAHRVIVIAIAALVAFAMTVVPAQADTVVPPALTCSQPVYSTTDLTVTAAMSDGLRPSTTVTGSMSVSWDGGATFEPLAASATLQTYMTSQPVTLTGLFDDHPVWPAVIQWVTNAGTATCVAEHLPVRVIAAGPSYLQFGSRAAYMVELDAPTVDWTDSLVVVAYLTDGTHYQEIGSARVTSWGRAALITASPKYTGYVAFYVFDEASDPDHLWPWNDETDVRTSVSHTSPYIEYNKTVVDGQKLTVKFWMGSDDSRYWAQVERYNGLQWVTLGFASGGEVLGTERKDLTFKPVAGVKYRIAWYPEFSSWAPHYTSLPVTVLPKVAISAASTVTTGTAVTFTVKHPLATSGTGKLQYYSGGAWKTAKTFALSSTTTTKVTYKVTHSYKWRAVVGANASASKTVTVK